MSRLMDKLLGECSKWLELFTPQVKCGVARERDLSRREDFLVFVCAFCFIDFLSFPFVFMPLYVWDVCLLDWIYYTWYIGTALRIVRLCASDGGIITMCCFVSWRLGASAGAPGVPRRRFLSDTVCMAGSIALPGRSDLFCFALPLGALFDFRLVTRAVWSRSVCVCVKCHFPTCTKLQVEDV